jgi:predicted RNA-binding protein (virulence factor B family)
MGEWLGTIQALPAVRRVQAGLLLDGGDLGEVLLPARELTGEAPEGPVSVFLYQDGEGRPRATLRRPRAMPGEVARLRVVATSRVGAFLDWGLPKDLLLPFAEQRGTPEVDRWQMVKVVRDREGRLFASARLDRYLEDTCQVYRQGEAVPVMVVQATDLGYKVAVANRYWGLLDAAGTDPRPGRALTAYVQRLRADHRLGLALDPPGAAKSEALADRIVSRLQQSGGFLPLGDASAPAAIRAAFGCSKNAFKQAIGKLYKERRIVLADDGIRLP